MLQKYQKSVILSIAKNPAKQPAIWILRYAQNDGIKKILRKNMVSPCVIQLCKGVIM
jgi:hypothetical protein